MHKNRGDFLKLAFILAAVAGLSGCDGMPRITAEPESTENAHASMETYLFYDSPLTAVDPADPSNPAVINPPGTVTANVTSVQHGGYSAATRMISDRHGRTIVYRLPDTGEWWKISAMKGYGLVPARLSNETAATAVCSTPVNKPDYRSHENARIVYQLPGPDTVCDTADDIWNMLWLGMAASDAPVPAYAPVAALHDTQTGALTGWLAKNGNSLYAYDTEFTNPVLVTNFTTDAVQTAVAPGGIVFLLIDDVLHAYNPNASPATLSAPLHAVAASLIGAVTDGSHLYFGDADSIYRVPLDGNGPASLVVTDMDGYIYSIVLTNSRVVYTNLTNAKLRSVPKSGGAVTDLGVTWSLTAAAGSRVYFNTLTFGVPWVHAAHVIDDDGSNYVIYPDAAWTPVQQDTAYFGAAGQSLTPGKMILREGANAAPFTLKSYDAAAHTLIASLGTLPAELSGFTNFRFTRLPNANHLLLQAYSDVNNSYDVLLLNTQMPDSLTRLTDTAADNEALVGSSGCSITNRTEFDPVLPLLLLAALVGCRLRRSRITG